MSDRAHLREKHAQRRAAREPEPPRIVAAKLTITRTCACGLAREPEKS